MARLSHGANALPKPVRERQCPRLEHDNGHVGMNLNLPSATYSQAVQGEELLEPSRKAHEVSALGNEELELP